MPVPPEVEQEFQTFLDELMAGQQVPRMPGPISKLKLHGVVRKDKQGTCKPGERADLTHCTPANRQGGGTAISSRSSDGGNHAPPGPSALSKIKATKEAAAAVAARIGHAVWDPLPPKAKTVLASFGAKAMWLEHKAMAGFRNSKELAGEVAQQWGLSEKWADRMARTLGYMDLATSWGMVNAGVGGTLGGIVGGPAGAIAGAKVATWVPVFSLGFIAMGSVNPYKTIAAAKALARKHREAVKKFFGRLVRKAEVEDPKRQLADALGEALSRLDESQRDWYMALFSVAMDENQGDHTKAIPMADGMMAANPTEPESDDWLNELDEEGEGPKNDLPTKGFYGVVLKHKGGPCEQGESAEQTGCIPASKDPSQQVQSQVQQQQAVAAEAAKNNEHKAKISEVLAKWKIDPSDYDNVDPKDLGQAVGLNPIAANKLMMEMHRDHKAGKLKVPAAALSAKPAPSPTTPTTTPPAPKSNLPVDGKKPAAAAKPKQSPGGKVADKVMKLVGQEVGDAFSGAASASPAMKVRQALEGEKFAGRINADDVATALDESRILGNAGLSQSGYSTVGVDHPEALRAVLDAAKSGEHNGRPITSYIQLSDLATELVRAARKRP